jgi:hypothetical protein
MKQTPGPTENFVYRSNVQGLAENRGREVTDSVGGLHEKYP